MPAVMVLVSPKGLPNGTTDYHRFFMTSYPWIAGCFAKESRKRCNSIG